MTTNPDLEHTPQALARHMEGSVMRIMLATMPKNDTLYDLLDIVVIRALGEAALQTVKAGGGHAAARIIEAITPHVTKRLIAISKGEPVESEGRETLEELRRLIIEATSSGDLH